VTVCDQLLDQRASHLRIALDDENPPGAAFVCLRERLPRVLGAIGITHRDALFDLDATDEVLDGCCELAQREYPLDRCLALGRSAQLGAFGVDRVGFLKVVLADQQPSG
jgi:hypothetical protein